jgi:predicted O-linked N-acetylglucosamine transferase (SPINDLY family)
MPELIAESPDAYRERLLELVAAPRRLAGYREQLLAGRERSPLFDTAGFTRDWEALLVEIYDDAVRGSGGT